VIPESARGETLARIFAAEPLVAAWFAGQGDGPSATADLASCLSGAVTAQPAPWFASAAADAWCADLAADLAGEEDRKRVRDACAALRQGRARVVVTGQQPGFLGGPLYTLHKVATAITLARRLSAAGQPTIPLFWSGDDDDDLPEAVAPVAWLPGSDTPVRSEWAGSAGRRASIAIRQPPIL